MQISHTEYGDSVSWTLTDSSVGATELVRGSAEFTLNFMIGDVPYVFFNRLVINPVSARGHGYGSALMTAVLPFFDERGLTIINPMNPYDPSKEGDTLRFFRKFGFEDAEIATIAREDAGNLLMRKPHETT